jgi:hypothetical protein
LEDFKTPKRRILSYDEELDELTPEEFRHQDEVGGFRMGSRPSP